MLTFFRKIRLQLLSDRGAIKYIKYAIGEIILVVIGILIAVQINNWNTQRKNKGLVKAYYVQILQDLEKDEALMINGNSYIDAFLDRYESYQELFRSNKVSLWAATTEIGQVFSAQPIQGSNFEVNTNTITTLLNTGDIKLIPTEIRNMLLDFKYEQSGLIDYIKTQSNLIYNAIIETQKLYGGADLPTRIAKHPELIDYFSNDKIAIQTLLELEALLYEQTLLLKNSKKRSEELLEEMHALRKVLQKEIEQ